MAMRTGRDLQNPGVCQQVAERLARIEVFFCDLPRSFGVKSIVFSYGLQSFGGLFHRVNREQSLSGRKDILKACRLKDGGTPSREVARRSVAEPSTVGSHVSSLGAAKLAQGARNILAELFWSRHHVGAVDDPAAALEEAVIWVFGTNVERQLQGLFRQTRQLDKPPYLFRLRP